MPARVVVTAVNEATRRMGEDATPTGEVAENAGQVEKGLV
jgi:hypothetical protein